MKKVLLINKYLMLACILLITSCSSSDDDDPTIITPPPVSNTLGGDYTGSWNSTTPSATFNNLSVSARLTVNSDGTRLVGKFYISSSFTSPFGSADDGSLVIDINGKTITGFSYADNIPNCTGNFTGSGIINDSGNLIIDFTGTDCDGAHVGQIILRK